MFDILYVIIIIIFCNSLGEKNKIFFQQLINKKKMIFGYLGKDYFFVGFVNIKNGIGENSSKRDRIFKFK